MRRYCFFRLVSFLLAIMFLAGISETAFAAGTASGTNVDNSATVDYQVDGIDQSQINSNTASFVVDNRVDLTVATSDVAAVQVVPGSSDKVLTYTVTNDGNTVQDYSLTAQAASGSLFGVTDNFDANNVEVYVDANSNGTYESATDVATYIDELAADASITVFVVSDIPVGQNDGDGALYDLIAQTAQGGTASSQGADITTDDAGSADDPNTVQIVFADGAGTADAANDGQHSSTDAYVVVNADLSVVKSSQVISDPINGGSNPKAIPGATLRYTLTVTNDGTADADNVVIIDAIPGNTTYSAGTMYLDAVNQTDANDADDADYNVTNAGAVTFTIATVTLGGGSSTITFDVVVD